MNIRYATMADLDDIASVESECFPVLEAATKEEFEQRIKYYGNHFWLMGSDVPPRRAFIHAHANEAEIDA